MLQFQVGERTIGARRPHTRLSKHYGDHGLPILDFFPAFAAQRGERHWLEMDDHLNDPGNPLAAREIVPLVLDLLGGT